MSPILHRRTCHSSLVCSQPQDPVPQVSKSVSISHSPYSSRRRYSFRTFPRWAMFIRADMVRHGRRFRVKLVLRAACLIRVCRAPTAMFSSGTRCLVKTGRIKKRLRTELQAMTRTWDVHVWDDHVNFWLPEWMRKITGVAEGGH